MKTGPLLFTSAIAIAIGLMAAYTVYSGQQGFFYKSHLSVEILENYSRSIADNGFDPECFFSICEGPGDWRKYNLTEPYFLILKRNETAARWFRDLGDELFEDEDVGRIINHLQLLVKDICSYTFSHPHLFHRRRYYYRCSDGIPQFPVIFDGSFHDMWKRHPHLGYYYPQYLSLAPGIQSGSQSGFRFTCYEE